MKFGINFFRFKHRIFMRNAQFIHPVSEHRIQAIFRGEIKPIAFAYEKARFAA